MISDKISHVCRFCLCQDSELLIPLAVLLPSSLAIEDVVRFTGVEIQESYEICVECLNSIKKSAEFRAVCIENDASFHNLLDKASVRRKTEQATTRCNMKFTSEPPPLKFFDDKKNTTESFERCGDFVFEDCDVTEEVHNLYSANYIEPGEGLADDDDNIFDDSDSNIVAQEDAKISKKKANRKAESNKAGPCTMNKEPSPTASETVTEVRSRRNRKRYPKKNVLCHMCGKWIVGLDFHVAAVHLKQANFACPHCPVKMAHQANLQRHIEHVHENKISNHCELCGMGFKYKRTFKTHLRSVHNIGHTSFSCKLCSKKYTSTGTLGRHMKAAHGTQTYSCTTCGMIFKLKSRLRNHQRVHSDDRPYACKHCAKRFKYRHARAIHELAHSGILFDCTHCGKSFRYKAQYMMHLRQTHPGCVELTVEAKSNKNLDETA